MVLCCPKVLEKSVFKADVPNSGQAWGELTIFLLLGENLPHHIKWQTTIRIRCLPARTSDFNVRLG